MSNMNLNDVKDWVAGRGCDPELHDHIWHAQQMGCPRCLKLNPNWKHPTPTTPQTQRTTAPDNTIDLTTPPSALSNQSPSTAPPSSSIPIRRQKKQTVAHGTGAYNAFAGPADQKRLSGPANTTKSFLKTTHAGAPAFAFRSEAVKKIPATSEKELDVKWMMHLVTWSSQSFPDVEGVVYLGEPYIIQQTTTNLTNMCRNATPSTCPPDCTLVSDLGPL
jgi:hypothetical protein